MHVCAHGIVCQLLAAELQRVSPVRPCVSANARSQRHRRRPRPHGACVRVVLAPAPVHKPQAFHGGDIHDDRRVDHSDREHVRTAACRARLRRSARHRGSRACEHHRGHWLRRPRHAPPRHRRHARLCAGLRTARRVRHTARSRQPHLVLRCPPRHGDRHRAVRAPPAQSDVRGRLARTGCGHSSVVVFAVRSPAVRHASAVPLHLRLHAHVR